MLEVAFVGRRSPFALEPQNNKSEKTINWWPNNISCSNCFKIPAFESTPGKGISIKHQRIRIFFMGKFVFPSIPVRNTSLGRLWCWLSEPTPPISSRAIFIGTLPFIPVWLKFHDQDLNTDRMLMITTLSSRRRRAWDAMQWWLGTTMTTKDILDRQAHSLDWLNRHKTLLPILFGLPARFYLCAEP